MNQGRIWCVVNPTVGLPLFLGSVAITSLIVHASVMTHTTWMSTYWQGAKARTAMNDTPGQVAAVAPASNSAFAITIAPVTATTGKGETAFVVTVTPNPASTGAPDSTAMVAPPDKQALALAGPVEK
jgi:light-harvesting protein B-800-850 alpha chain